MFLPANCIQITLVNSKGGYCRDSEVHLQIGNVNGHILRWNLVMIVSHSHRFIFFHNPKCAGTSFRDTLKPYHDDKFTFWGVYNAAYFNKEIDHTHLRLWEIQLQFPEIFSCFETYNSVIFVRNPYDRFLSALNEHLKKFQTHVDVAGMPTGQRIEIIQSFIDNILDVSRIKTDPRFIHFSPQIWFLKLDDRKIPRHVIPIGDDGTFLLKALAVLGLPNLHIPHHNPSPVDLTDVLKSPALVKFVQDFYAEDFEFFRGDRRLAGLVDMPASAPATSSG